MKIKFVAKHAGDVVRGVSLLAVFGNVVSWYNSVNEKILYEVIGKIGNDVTGAVNIPLGIYGAGEAYNLGYKLVKGKKNGESTIKYLGRIARNYPVDLGSEILKIAPIASPLVARATDNDFFRSVFIPIGVCVGAHVIGYLNRVLNGNQISDLQDELYESDAQN